METLGILTSLISLIVLLGIGTPAGLAMLVSGTCGSLLAFGPDIAMTYLGTSVYRESANFVLLSIPLFVFMGALGTQGGLWGRLFAWAYSLVGRIGGGLAMAIVGAGAVLGAASGSSTANAAALGKVSIRESKKYGYEQRTVLACIASSGTIAVMIPPSITLIVYALLTETSVARLFAAGVVPGLLTAVALIGAVAVIARVRPESLPKGPRFTAREQLTATGQAAPILAVIGLVIVGIYAGLYTPTEAAAVGVLGIGILALVFGKIRFPHLFAAAREAAETTGMIFMIIVGAFIFGRFMSATRIPQSFADTVAGLPLGPYPILVILLCVYIVLGAFMDQLAIQVLTIPIVFPLIETFGFDPYWFAIIFVKTVEIGLLTPPLGLNVYVVSGMAKVPVAEAFRGIWPFLAADGVMLVALVAFPELSLWLPDLLLGKA
ncbi:TRAP transporter large permease [Streptomyces albidus (ex Kaewkla and Franco 2022)]|uniref:TRAP transporter large permease n=1 Tax=Streptomyces albidus (ex Kaewkla and Franco 2022) TaxID=722709 RepID=UPI0015EEAE0B|nr:TRAP transporter large permease [Streptomyces albidus (ex Kaewkla and Franco 2022)]